MIEQRKTRPAIFIILGLLLLWEVLYYLALLDPLRFSHPIGALQILGDSKFLRLFLAMLVQLAFSSLLGGGIGVGFGALIIRSAWLTQATIRFLHIGIWIPFFIVWPLPIWPPRDGYRYDPIIWAWITSVTAVTLSTCYHYLTARSTLGLEWREARAEVARSAILQALFISLISQIWVGEYGWIAYFIQPGGVAAGYASLILLVTLLFLINRIFQSNFVQTAEVRRTILASEVASRNWKSLSGAALFGLVCVVLWFLLSKFVSPSISSPLEVVKAGYRLLVQGTTIASRNITIWQHIGVSLIELSVGLILGGGAALIVFRGLSNSPIFRAWAFSVIPLTYVVTVLLSLVLIHWIGLLGSWQAAFSAASLTFFPFVQALWGLRDRPPLCRILLAADDALPFAFVGILFGELWGAVAGLGFFVAVARTYLLIAEGIAASLVTLVLFIALSSTLRWIVRGYYFPEGSSIHVVHSSLVVG